MHGQRRWVRTTWLAAGSVLAVASLGWGTQQTVSVLAHEERTERQVVAAAELEAIEVHTEVGRIEVVGSTGAEVRLTAEVVDGLSPTEVERTIVDGVLRIEARCTTPLGSPWCRADLRLEVPTRLEVRASSDDSGIVVRGVDGAVDVSSSSSAVLVEDATGPVRARSSGGGVEVRGGGPGPVDARSWAGDVRVEIARPASRVSARSAGGSVTVVVPRDDAAYAVSVDSSAGSTSAAVRTDPEASRSIDASSSAGDVTVRYRS
jgi:hypothetical protein